MIPMYSTMTFNDIWESADVFKSDYQDNGIPATIGIDSANTLYYLLYARYGNNPIANDDIEQFKYKVFSIIFQYGPTWEKKLEIQEHIRNLSEEDLRAGSKAIFNHSFNPSTDPSTDTLEELPTINDQNTSKNKRGKLEAYALLRDMLEEDVTEIMLSKFKVCFKQFIQPENPLLYVTEKEDN